MERVVVEVPINNGEITFPPARLTAPLAAHTVCSRLLDGLLVLLSIRAQMLLLL